MPVTSTASLKKGSQTVLGAYRGTVPAYNALGFYRNFAQLKSLNHGIGPDITFTRASGATYFDADGVLQTAANDVPRFDHDPADGSSLGLLIEEARTNLLERSAEFENAYWGKNQGTVTANTTVAPDGTTSADTFTGNATDGYLSRNFSGLTPSQTFTLSCYLRVSSGSLTTRLRIVDDLFLFIGNISPVVTTTWQRFSVSGVVPADGIIRCIIGGSSTIGSGVSVQVWGAQLEQGAFPTSYIPTTTAAATRSADSAVVTPISSFYNQSEGTLVAQLSTLTTAAGTFPYSLAIDDNTNNNRIELYASSASSTTAVMSSGAQQALQSFAGAITAGVAFTAGVAVGLNNLASSTNGQTALTDSSVLLPVGTDRLRIKPATNAHFRKIAYYPKRLSNTLLEQLTT